MTRVRETPMQGNLNDIFEVEFHFIGCQRIEESIERLLQLGFKIFESSDDLIDSRLAQQTARSVNEQVKVLVIFDVRRKLHCILSDASPASDFAASSSIGARSHCAASLRSWNTRALIGEP